MNRVKMAHTEIEIEPSSTYKVVFSGQVGVGKTTLVHWLKSNKFVDVTKETTHLDYVTTEVTVKGRKAKIVWWDTAGAERFRSISATYYRNPSAVVHVYSADNNNSFLELGKTEEELLSDLYKDQKVLRFVIGNKNDLEEKVNLEHVNNFCQKYNVNGGKHFITSALTRVGLPSSLEIIANTVVEEGRAVDATATLVDKKDSKKSKSRSCCK